MITQERLKELLHYDPETGIFTWQAKANRHGNRSEGIQAGCMHHKGYIDIGLDGRYYRAHRLAWLYVYGVWPSDQLDHDNRIKSDNRIENLRPATNKQNCENRGTRKDNTSGITGVYWYKPSSKWVAMIGHENRLIHIGYFKTIEDARIAREAMRDKLFTHHKKVV